MAARRNRPVGPAEWSVRRKVVAALALPVLVALVVSGVRSAELVRDSGDFSRDAEVSRAQQAAADLVRQAGREQVTVAARLVGLPGSDAAAAAAAPPVDQQQQRTDEAIARVLQRAGPLGEDSEEVRTRVRSVEGAVQRTSDVRGDLAEALSSGDPVSGEAAAELVRAYSDLSGAALRLGDALTTLLIDDSVQRQGATAQALSEVYRQVSLQDALALVVLGIPAGPDDSLPVTVEELLAGEAARVAAATELDAVAPADLQIRFAEATATSDAARERSRAYQLVLISLGGGPVVTAPPSPGQWVVGAAAVTDALDGLRSDVNSSQVAQAANRQGERLARAIVEALLVLAALLVGVFVTVALGTRIVQPLSTLRREAMETAEHHLPAAIARLREDGPTADVSVRPISVSTGEEVGQAARAFDAVSERAVRLAQEQEALRAGLNDVIVNLSRRSQSLVERQLQLIDALERDEENAHQLDQLFRLDHLASRMRRYNDNLLILAGGVRSRRSATEAMTLLDVLRAATSETEQYRRVNVRGAPDVAVASHAAPSLVHLVAELLDNATTFSDPRSEVEVSVAGRPGQALMIAIMDRGIGFPPAALAEANEKLARSLLIDPVADEGARRQMGLYVVGQLARNHGVRVELRPNAAGSGTVAEVVVPADLLLLPSGDRRPGGAPARPRAPERPLTPQPPVAWPAPAPVSDPPQPVPPTRPAPAGPAPAPPAASARVTTTPEETPLFFALSAWFRRESPPGGDSAFASPADEGWAAAAAAASSDGSEQVTAAGLPRRRPLAHLVPGSVGEVDAGPEAPVVREAGSVRTRLSKLQQGVRAGRANGTDGDPVGAASDAPGGPDDSDAGEDADGVDGRPA
ncbi:MAG: nitrate- and nitrite sensing domain-containing protein [Kineosporiaceae bacterium]